jgi:hypothetical protein
VALAIARGERRQEVRLKPPFDAAQGGPEPVEGPDAPDVPLDVLQRTRPLEAAFVRAQVFTARHDFDAANRALTDLLDAAPNGFAGWTIPVEPFLKELHRTQGFAGILTRLAERAR